MWESLVCIPNCTGRPGKAWQSLRFATGLPIYWTIKSAIWDTHESLQSFLNSEKKVSFGNDGIPLIHPVKTSVVLLLIQELKSDIIKR